MHSLVRRCAFFRIVSLFARSHNSFRCISKTLDAPPTPGWIVFQPFMGALIPEAVFFSLSPMSSRCLIHLFCFISISEYYLYLPYVLPKLATFLYILHSLPHEVSFFYLPCNLQYYSLVPFYSLAVAIVLSLPLACRPTQCNP